MDTTITPIKKGPNIPPGNILVNEKWRGSAFEMNLKSIGRVSYCGDIDIVDFYPSEISPVIYVNEGDLLSGVCYERKLKKMQKVVNQNPVIIADRNINTIKQFSELQDKCFSMNLTLIPIGNISELPQLLFQMAYIETKSPNNPFKQREKSRDDLAEIQLKLFTLIPGVGAKKAKILLDHFGHSSNLVSIYQKMYLSQSCLH
ncbi:hypothetical protein L9F63_001722 [Diploptera punctata]|uniref:Fanconi anemia core complex-associated protein 24 pseudonuclease domain-containing protein n=1 Tax=Diploptera punctata TaxID=6984 RepID=A0AAD8A3L6_DIPPU|nr:hypothetical protein L9F63_001722 [Diploptera punctata]